jgi:peptidoglycan/LPS O-acetylase OafA/YrhL
MTTARDQEHIAPLDGLRAISILLVLAAHLLPLGPKSLQLNATAGTAGMSLFFVLSGFLIARSAAFESAAAFALKRLARILPLAWLYIGVVAIIHGTSAEQLLAEALFVLNYNQHLIRPETAHLWSLAVELHFYIAVTLVLLIDRRAIVLAIPACLAVTALRVNEGIPYSILTHLRIDEILAGVCVALAPVWWRGAARGGGAASIVLLGLTCHPDAGDLGYLRPYAGAAVLFTLLASANSRTAAWLSTRPLRYIARISYALYVIHPLLAHGWWNSGTLVERYLLKRPLAVVLTFALAHLSTFSFERRWIHLAKRLATIIDGRVPPRAGVAPAARVGGAATERRAQHPPAADPSRRPPAAP